MDAKQFDELFNRRTARGILAQRMMDAGEFKDLCDILPAHFDTFKKLIYGFNQESDYSWVRIIKAMPIKPYWVALIPEKEKLDPSRRYELGDVLVQQKLDAPPAEGDSIKVTEERVYTTITVSNDDIPYEDFVKMLGDAMAKADGV